MRYQEPSLEILLLVSGDVITSSNLQDTPAGGSNEGGSFDDLFGTNKF